MRIERGGKEEDGREARTVKLVGDVRVLEGEWLGGRGRGGKQAWERPAPLKKSMGVRGVHFVCPLIRCHRSGCVPHLPVPQRRLAQGKGGWGEPLRVKALASVP